MYKLQSISPRWIVLVASIGILIIYITHMQTNVNGLIDPYTTDVGEIQNALPRWGTLHFTGYPLYTLIGSIFVTFIRWFGLEPAAGASLYSAVWGAVSIVILIWVMLALDVPTPLAAGASLLFGLSRSMWIDSTIAELHTMTMALTFATILVAIRLYKQGEVSDLYWLAFLSGQGLAHQRAFAFMGLGILVLVYSHWRLLWNRKQFLISFLLILLGPLTYVYLPIRAWMGADWTFSSPGTWEGFKAIILDTKADRIINIPISLQEWWGRSQEIVRLLNQDWPWPLWSSGLIGLLISNRLAHIRWGLTLSWIPNFVLSLIIWEDRVSDALLAVKLPIVAVSAIGLALLSHWVWLHFSQWRVVVISVLLLLNGHLFFVHRPKVLAITRDDTAQGLINLVAAIPSSADGRPQTMMALWGDDLWPLAYAQAYNRNFPELTLVQHDRNFATIADKGHLYTLSRTLYQRPIPWWEERLGSVYLTSIAPDILELKTEPLIAPISSEKIQHDLENGIVIQSSKLTRLDLNTLELAINWQAQQSSLENFSIAVHLISQDPPTVSEHIVAQFDRNAPVYGWYLTSSWQAGEVVVDHFSISIPESSKPIAVRINMYRQLADGSFANSPWLTLPIP